MFGFGLSKTKKSRKQVLRSRKHGHFQKLENRDLLAVDFQLLKDINTTAASTPIETIVATDQIAYFVADTPARGKELWRTDGTAAGTKLVKDIAPGARSSNPTDLIVMNGNLYFVADDGVHGRELWKTDGTASGTVMVKDIFSGTGSGFFTSQSALMTVSGNNLYFLNGVKLWKSNGTTAGTVEVATVQPREMVDVNGTLYFSAYATGAGYELWKSNGTNAGTKLVKDINPGTTSSQIGHMTNFNGTLLFQAWDGVHGSELWKSNGTAASTKMVTDLAPGSAGISMSNIVVLGSSAYFYADISGDKLWKVNSTATAVNLVYAKFGGDDLNSLIVVGNELQFTSGFGYGTKLWKSDGTTTIAVNTFQGSAGPLTVVGNTTFFTVDLSTKGNELWKSDGTAATTKMVKDIYLGDKDSSPAKLTAFAGMLLFTADDGKNGRELWRSNGVASGTKIVKNLVSGTNGSNVRNPVVFNNDLYFSADNGVDGTELWHSDGTTSGTELFKDLNLSGSSFPTELKGTGATRYFIAQTDPFTRQFIATDGTIAGTVPFADYPGLNGSFDVLNGWIYYSEFNRLMRTDGSTTETLATLFGTSVGNITTVGNQVFFSGESLAEGVELWKTNGTASGTVLVKDINAGSSDSSPFNFANVNGVLYFSAYDNVHGRELWKSNGTTNGTQLVKDIEPGTSSSSPSEMTSFNGAVLFSASNANGRELWTSKGTAATTTMVKNIASASASSSPRYFASASDGVYFVANSTTGIPQLWKSNGAAARTSLVYTFRTGDPGELTIAGDKIFAAIDTDAAGLEWYVSSLPSSTTPPTGITLSSNKVAENRPVNSLVGTISSIGGSPGSTYTYSLVAGTGSTDNAKFKIVGNQLKTNAVFDYESQASFVIRLKTTNQSGQSYSRSYKVFVTDVNEKPTGITVSKTAVPENKSTGTVVGTLGAIDQDANNTFTFTLVSGAGSTDNASFRIVGNSLRTRVVFDYEQKSSYSIRVRVTDQNGLFFERAFNIRVTNIVNEV